MIFHDDLRVQSVPRWDIQVTLVNYSRWFMMWVGGWVLKNRTLTILAAAAATASAATAADVAVITPKCTVVICDMACSCRLDVQHNVLKICDGAAP